MRISQNKPWLRIFSLTIGVLLLLSGPSFAKSVLNSTELIVAQPDSGGGTLLKVASDGTLTLKNSLNAAGEGGLTGGDDGVSVGVNGIASTINASATDTYLVTQKAVYDYINEVLVALGVATESITATTTIPIGMIAPFGGTTTANGWLECNGDPVLLNDYPALYSVLQGAFGVTTNLSTSAVSFYLPDLRGRTAIGAGTGSGLSARTVGQTVGTETHTLTEAQIPSHSHGLTMSQGNQVVAGLASVSVQPLGANYTTGSTGGGEDHPIMQPSLVVKYYIYAGVNTP